MTAKKTTRKKTVKKSVKGNRTFTITYNPPEYTKATKTLPPKIGKKHIFSISCDADLIRAIHAFQKDYDMGSRSVACRVALKRFLKEEGYLN
jgi:hypothetical protein